MLKWFLASLKSQQYAGRQPSQGVKKPLNAFLGEVFIGDVGATEDDQTHLIAEQVSHHPPVTACYLWNDKHGVRAEGYTRQVRISPSHAEHVQQCADVWAQDIRFTGTVNITQIGHAILHVDAFDEDYLIPLPNVKVTGILTGSPYPELQGSYSIVCSNGYVAEVDFSGKRMFGLAGDKNHVTAAVYPPQDKKHKEPIYVAQVSLRMPAPAPFVNDICNIIADSGRLTA